MREGNGGVVNGSTHIHEPIPPCDARRREKVGALYSAVSGLLASSAEHTLNFSLLCHGI